jgi:hypothetical protein
MESYTVEQFLQLEFEVWNALATGDAEADTRLLTDNFLGVYGSGFSGKNDHTDQLRDGPTVAHFDLSEARIQVLSEKVVLLSYRANWVRYENTSEDVTESMYVTSIWKNLDGAWKNIFSQDTPAQG